MSERVLLSDIYATIQEFQEFLFDITKKTNRLSGVESKLATIIEINKQSPKALSIFMSEKVEDEDGKKRTRWNCFEWWLASTMNYNNLCITRIDNVRTGQSKNRFNHESQIEKLINNSTQRKKGWKTSVVEAWFDYCVQNEIDPRIFQDADSNGVDYDN